MQRRAQLHGVNETAKWLSGRRLFQPIRACTMMLDLSPVFAFVLAIERQKMDREGRECRPVTSAFRVSFERAPQAWQALGRLLE
jgi:hypothetical protein